MTRCRFLNLLHQLTEQPTIHLLTRHYFMKDKLLFISFHVKHSPPGSQALGCHASGRCSAKLNSCQSQSDIEKSLLRRFCSFSDQYIFVSKLPSWQHPCCGLHCLQAVTSCFCYPGLSSCRILKLFRMALQDFWLEVSAVWLLCKDNWKRDLCFVFPGRGTSRAFHHYFIRKDM